MWCHPTISSSVNPPSSCLQFFLTSRSFPMSWFFASGGQSIGASASVLPMNIQDLFPLGLTALISLQCKGLSRIFSSTVVQKLQFVSTQLSFMVQLPHPYSKHISNINCSDTHSKKFCLWKIIHNQVFLQWENNLTMILSSMLKLKTYLNMEIMQPTVCYICHLIDFYS